MAPRRTVSGSLSLLGLLACQQSLSPPAPARESPEVCRAKQAQLVALLEDLPEKGLAVRGRADLPMAALGGVIGSGRVVDIAPDAVRLDGQTIEGANPAQRIERLRQLLAETKAAPADGRSLLYLALARDTDVASARGYLEAIPRTFDVQLLFQSPPPKTGAGSAVGSVSEQLLSESDLPTRQALARSAYAKFAHCQPLLTGIDGVAAGDPSQRWPALREALLEALPKCQCNELEADELRELFMAEQRAGAAAVGALPFDFLRDERCGASLGLTPLQKVVQDIEAFDEQFSGAYGAQSLDFQQIVTNDHLLEYLCQALPGETLAALQRSHQKVFWKVRGVEHCQAWQFEPLAAGSPMGSWRRIDDATAPALAVHYWQGAEEIRLYGPVPDAASKPTDERAWACNQDFRLRGIDAESISLETGRWFFSEAACQRSSEADAAFPGCIAALAGGPPELPPAVPATFPALGDGREAAP
jgi:hypothetical protein